MKMHANLIWSKEKAYYNCVNPLACPTAYNKPTLLYGNASAAKEMKQIKICRDRLAGGQSHRVSVVSVALLQVLTMRM